MRTPGGPQFGRRASPRRATRTRFVPIAIVSFFLLFWTGAYFTISPGFQPSDVNDVIVRGSPSRVRITSTSTAAAEDDGGEPKVEASGRFKFASETEADAETGANDASRSGREQRWQNALESAESEEEELAMQTIQQAAAGNAFESPPSSSATLADKTDSPAAGATMLPSIDDEEAFRNMSLSLLSRTADLYKTLKYDDLVEKRWFDEDFDKEEKHDMIQELGGDNLGDVSMAGGSGVSAPQHIPKKLHFTWKTAELEDLPELFKKIQLKWRMLNPDWEIKIWTDEECDHFVKTFYPEYYFFYSDFEVTAERSDIFRYLVLDHHGGYYADMDMEPLQPMDGLVEVVRQPQCMIGLEPEVHAILAYNKYHVIGNAFMGSVPNHPLWKWLIPQTIKRYFNDRNPKDEKDATKITGPIALDNVVQRNPEITRTCVLLKPDVTGPAYDLSQNAYERCQEILNKPQWQKTALEGEEENPYVRICKQVDQVGDENKAYPPEAFAVHHWAHTWRAKPEEEKKPEDGLSGKSWNLGSLLGGKGSADAAADAAVAAAEDAEAQAAMAKEPAIHAETNIGKEVLF